MKKPVKVGFVGAGQMTMHHARAFQGLAGVELVGLASRTWAKAEAAAAEVGLRGVTDSVSELIEQTRPDVLVISVSILSTAEVLRKVLDFPGIILVEKPAGYHLAQAEALAREGAGRSIYVALNRRFYGSTLELLHGLKEDDAARFIHVQDQESPRAARSLGFPAAVLDHWMYANAIHVVDYLRLLGRGEMTRVQVVQPWQREKSCVVIAQVEFSSGDQGVYEAVWEAPGPWAVAVTTPAARWELRPLEKLGRQAQGERHIQWSEPDPVDQQFKPGLRRQAEAVLAAARGEKTVLPTLGEALETMKLIHTIYGA